MEKGQENSDTDQQSLSANAYEYLLARLRSGQLKPNERLVEADIALQLGVSRVPVRQALLQLVAEDYLFSTPRGYKVPTLTEDDILEVFELRLLLEPRAAALAARDISMAQLSDIDRSIDDAKSAHAANDVSSVYDAGRRFRDSWIVAVKNARLAATITRYGDQVALVRRVTLRDPVRQKSVIAAYEELRAAFERRDSIGAHDSMMRFVLSAQRDFIAVTRQQ